MSASKLIVIVGATGNQGGSLASVYLQEPGWKVRAITRNTTSAKAKDLAARGAEVVQADLDAPATLSAAFKGANVVFAVSDFWGLVFDPSNQDKPKPGQSINEWAGLHETQLLKNAIDAAAKVPTLERFILSSLSNATKWSKGKYTHVYHFDSKANAEDYGKATYPDLWAKTSVFQAGLFLSNYLKGGISQPTKGADGVVQLASKLDPEVKFPYIAPDEDTGPIVKALIDDTPGKNLIGYRAWLTTPEVSAAFAKATGLKVNTVNVPKGVSAPGLSADMARSVEENMGFWNEFGYEGRDDPTVIHPRDLKSPPSLATVEDYFKKYDWTLVFGK
ncbi:hypothetical protein DHEL01_v213006 [Diaporthe helianthi]|uniref:NmrA-like domain-containing protein n=1 Tax=Diaporthe helianthi TaxID=158607 RepID=A0A2P5HED6_DIAHE|nr:hypothetical protein DHEL01_v213006 [Diaporthe helianthi]